ncbi:hypothetical protein [Leptolyngbya sp. O-77]|uniref:hypothetical protein n=1 Tax=Leptolyngbya sp. O-77 TaxID=1080068 RepID=UPI00074D32EF|nr:hypothetical protein [Leptolyngbya sp. O-77]BAU44046.1 hypothetical protein O77CONTIG1_03879 [Leptolyngbya sp. O-77]
MKPTHRSSIHPGEIGGAIAPPSCPPPSSAAGIAAESEELADSLYIPQPQKPESARRVRSLKRQQQARAIAEGRLTQIGEELLGLADELRSLNPDLSDSLDDAWSDVEHALEMLLDEAAW